MRNWAAAGLVVLTLIVGGCADKDPATGTRTVGAEVKRAETPEEIARVVVQGLISGDPKLIDSVINKDASLTDGSSLLATRSKYFTDRKEEDFDYYVDDERHVVSVQSKDKKTSLHLDINKVNGKYYLINTTDKPAKQVDMLINPQSK